MLTGSGRKQASEWKEVTKSTLLCKAEKLVRIYRQLRGATPDW